MKCPICNINDLPEKGLTGLVCVDCVRTGKQMEFWLTNEVRNNMLGKIRALDSVSSANLWPTGPGNFELGVVRTDGKIVRAGSSITIEGEATGIAATIPDAEGTWGFAVWDPETGELSGDPVFDLEDNELIEAIAQL